MTLPLTDKAVEAGARVAALNAFEKCRPVERVTCQDFGMQQRDILSQQLDAAIDAYRAALAAEGLCVVPREPTQAMERAAIWALERWREQNGNMQERVPPGMKHSIRYRAMIEAAQGE